MKAMVEADLQEPRRGGSLLDDRSQLADRAGARFLDEHVRPARESSGRSLREGVVGGGGDNDVRVALEQLVQRAARDGTGLTREFLRGAGVHVVAGRQPVRGEHRGPLAAHVPTAHEPDFERHRYSVPKQPWKSKPKRTSAAPASARAILVRSTSVVYSRRKPPPPAPTSLPPTTPLSRASS